MSLPDPTSAQLIDPAQYSKLSYAGMLALTKDRGQRPSPVQVFELNGTGQVTSFNIVYSKYGDEVYTWPTSSGTFDLSKSKRKATTRPKEIVERMTGQSGWYKKNSSSVGGRKTRRRRTNKNRTIKRRSNKRKTSKRRSNKGKSSKRRTNKRR